MARCDVPGENRNGRQMTLPLQTRFGYENRDVRIPVYTLSHVYLLSQNL